MPKLTKALVGFIAVTITIYLSIFIVVKCKNLITMDSFSPIRSSNFFNFPTKLDSNNNFLLEYPLSSLIEVPYNLKFNIEIVAYHTKTDKINGGMIELLICTDKDCVDVKYKDYIYLKGGEIFKSKYDLKLPQTANKAYVMLTVVDRGVSFYLNKAVLAWNIILHQNLAGIIINEILFNNKTILISLLFFVLAFRSIFIKYYSNEVHEELKFDFQGKTLWILVGLAIAFQVYLVMKISYPLYEHDYEILQRAVLLDRYGSSSSVVDALGYYNFVSLPPVILACLMKIVDTNSAYFIFIASRIITIFCVYFISKSLYQENTAAILTFVYASFLPFNLLYESNIMNIAGYDKNYYIDIAKISAATFLYMALASGFVALDKSKRWETNLLLSFFHLFAFAAILTRFEVLISYGILTVLMAVLIKVLKKDSTMFKTYVALSLFFVILSILYAVYVLYYLGNPTNRVGGTPLSPAAFYTSMLPVLNFLHYYYTTDHNFSISLMIICPIFFRMIMLKFSIRTILMELILVCSFATVIFAMWQHWVMYARMLYVIPLQAIIAGIGTVALYHFCVQAIFLIKKSFSKV